MRRDLQSLQLCDELCCVVAFVRAQRIVVTVLFMSAVPVHQVHQ